jgi:hypothetical protein
MLMVIIGAGASYDSSPDKPARPGDGEAHRPPLADNLFLDSGLRHTARLQFPIVHEIVPELLPRPGRSLEESLQRLQDESVKDPHRLRQLTAVRYYLQYLFRSLGPAWLNDIGSVTNYLALIGQIIHHRRDDDPDPICLVTFNYDTLIEHALEMRVEMKINKMGDYVSDKNFKLFKLHGSENWGRTLTSAPSTVSWVNKNPWGQPEEIISHIDKVSVSDTYVIAGKQAYQGPALFPAVAIPVLSKDQFECPPTHIAALEALIPRVTKILTIGWRGKEQHFLNMLTKGLGGSATGIDIVTVAGTKDEAQQTLAQIRAASIPIRVGPRFVGGCYASFSDCLAERQFNPLLSTV